MRNIRTMTRRLLTCLLAAILACGSVPAQVAWALETSEQQIVYDVSAQAETGAESVAAEELEAAAENSSAGEDAASQADDTVSDAGAPAEASDEVTGDASEAKSDNTSSLYSIEATFGDDELGENTALTSNAWTSGSKLLNVKLTKNPAASIDSSKRYVLCMKVPDTLYFNGVPEASDITGVDDVAMVQNPRPTVYTYNARSQAYSLSPYSGEIRMLLNTSVDNVTVPELGINFDQRLVGFKVTNGNTISNALGIRVIEVEGDKALADLGSNDMNSEIASRSVSSLLVQNNGSVSSDAGVRVNLSTDGFNKESIVSSTVNMSKGGTIAYSLSVTAGTYHIFGDLKVVFKCPYINVDLDGDGTPEKHYLECSESDVALSSNKQGNYTGAKATSIVYDKGAHTITYEFENLSLSAYNIFLYTPNFSLPSDVASELSVPSEGIDVVVDPWQIVTQKTYTGDDATLLPSTYKMPATAKAVIIPEAVDITLQSSAGELDGAKATKRTLAQHMIYRELTPDNQSIGALGFFDVHNVGVRDSGELEVSFDFNTANSGAKYYVTRVNIPLDGNTRGTDVTYVLENGSGNTVSGTKHYANTSSFSVWVSALRSDAGVGDGYFIKSITYTAAKFRANAQYHADVTHGWRNSSSDFGQFFGYVTGEAGQTASAEMTVKSADATGLDSDGATELSVVETSTVSNYDSVGLGLQGSATVDGASSQSIVAGKSATLSFKGYVPVDEYRGNDDSGKLTNSVNGYHVMRSPVVYVCLPENVSIAGSDQASMEVTCAGLQNRSVASTSVERLKGSECVIDGVNAVWWEVRYDGANIACTGDASLNVPYFTVSLQLSTSSTMAGVNWNFEKAIAVRSYGQALNWTSQTSVGSIARNKASDLQSDSNAMLKALGDALASDDYAQANLGVMYYTNSVSTTLNISRAEAKLDVSTALLQEGQASEPGAAIKVTDENATLDYDVNVSSTEGGTAHDFSYYIPIVKSGAALDASAFTTKSDFSLELTGEVGITGSNADGAELEGMPFDVLYTTEANLTSSNIQSLDAGKWQTADTLNGDFSRVTAVKIITKDNEEGGTSTISPDSSYKFELKLVYDNVGNDFAANAGRSVAWRTFGHYVYERNGDTTENTYPSGVNSVKLGYVLDMTSTPIDVVLDTSTGAQGVASVDLVPMFNTNKTLKIKSVARGNLNLTSEDPRGYSGTTANQTFRMALGLNGQAKRNLSDGAGGSYGVAAGEGVSADIAVDFSTALTDASSQRYVDVVIGDDDIDITVRVNLRRTVKPADATEAGVAEGENYAAPKVSGSVTIANNSAFTALFPVSGFVPANYSAQKLKWKTADGAAANIPSGTTIIMVGLKDDNTADSYWLYRSTGGKSQVDLSEFKSMDAGQVFSYDTESSTQVTLKYLFVVNFSNADAANGPYKIAFGADAISGVTAFTDVDRAVELVDPATYSLTAAGSTLTYGVSKSAGNESYLERKSLSLVLKPAGNSGLPTDAKLSDGAQEYERNAKGEFVIPLGTIDSGAKSFRVVSSQLPSSGGSYSFVASLVLVGTSDASSPDAGEFVKSATLTLGTASSPSPSLSVTGTRVATVADWKSGQQFELSVAGLDDGCSLTVKAYRGLTGSDQVTDLLSSVGGCFTIESGVGSYNAKASTGKLQLSSVASPGTYRLVFEIRDATDTLLTTVPYAIIVRD